MCIRGKVAAWLHFLLVSPALRALNVQDGHGTIPPIKLARPEERDGNLRAISLLDFLACFPVK